MITERLTDTTLTTWKCPIGVEKITIECYGAGGFAIQDGNPPAYQQSNSASGGGYGKKIDFKTVPGQTYSIQIGTNTPTLHPNESPTPTSYADPVPATFFKDLNNNIICSAKGGDSNYLHWFYYGGKQATGNAPGGLGSNIGDIAHSGGGVMNCYCGGGGGAGPDANGTAGNENVPANAFDGLGGAGGGGEAGVGGNQNQQGNDYGSGAGGIYSSWGGWGGKSLMKITYTKTNNAVAFSNIL